MRNTKKQLSRAVLRASAAPIVLGLALASTSAFAQDQDAEEDEDVIVVTGSRIANPNLEQSSPIQVVGEGEIDLRQATNAEELIGELPGVASGISSSVNNGSGGFATFNLRGLGSNRNLILLDGARVVPSSVRSVTDLNVIPVALVDRVEIVTGGASSVYGADAIAGVVNFVLKRDFEGVEIGSTFGITEEGDGERFRTDVTIGGNFADGRGNAVLSVGYQNTKAVLQGDRAISRQALFFGGQVVGSGTSVPTALNGVQYNPATDSLGTIPNNTFNYAPFNYFQTPLERFNVFGQASYEVTDNIEVYSKAMFTKSINRLQLAPAGLFGITLNIPLNNPFISTAVRNQLCAAQAVPIAQAACDAAGAATDPTAAGYLELPTTVNRRLVEQGNRQTTNTTNQFQIQVGTRGSITDTINFDLYAQYGESDRTRAQINNGLRSRVQQALRTSSLNGADPTQTCAVATNGCVPINLFGTANGGQNISAASVAFFNQGVFRTVSTSLAVVSGSVNGDFGVSSPFADNPIGFAIGGEYREYNASQIADVPNGTQSEVLGNGAPSPSFSGSYDVREIFGELIVPVVEDVPGIYSLSLEGGLRYSDYSNTGGSTTWKVGGTYEPVEGFKFRGVYQRAVRSPNIGELFSPVTTGLTNLTQDPCQGQVGGANNPDLANANLRAICIAQGATAAQLNGFTIPAPSANQINATSGGNAALDVETATTLTLGAVITPPSLPGFALTVDYYSIKVSGAITTPTPNDILNPCFGSAQAPFTNGNPASPSCALIRRNPLNGSLNGGGDTPGLLLQLTNQGVLRSAGVDLRMTYTTDVSFGALSWDMTANWTDKDQFQSSAIAANRECVGQFSQNCDPILPEFSFNLRTTVSLRDLMDISLLWRWIDGTQLERTQSRTGFTALQTVRPTVPAVSYFDLSLRSQIMDNLGVTLSIQNLLDKSPPNVSSFTGSSSFNSGNTYPSTYDAIGRRYTISTRLRF